MCIAVSLASEFRNSLSLVKVPIVIETLLYQSSQRLVLISFDFAITNYSQTPIDLFLTHIDDVQAWLGTCDWLTAANDDCDERVALVNQVYGNGVRFDPDDCRFFFTDPLVEANSYRSNIDYLDAQAIIYGIDGEQKGALTPSSRGICDQSPFRSRGHLVHRFENHPETTQSSHAGDEHHRVFSSFRLSGIPPADSAGSVFARVTMLIQNGAYRRLVQPQSDSPFAVISARRVQDQIEQRLEGVSDRQPDLAAFSRFYRQEVFNGVIVPEKYHIIIAQPDQTQGNSRIRCRPASGSISERYIADPEARQRAMWFSAWSPDFSLVLAYADGRNGGHFRQRLPPDVSPELSWSTTDA